MEKEKVLIQMVCEINKVNQCKCGTWTTNNSCLECQKLSLLKEEKKGDE